MIRHCPKCYSDLEETAKTTTHHSVLTCTVCNVSWVAWYDELKQISSTIDLSAYVPDFGESGSKEPF